MTILATLFTGYVILTAALFGIYGLLCVFGALTGLDKPPQA